MLTLRRWQAGGLEMPGQTGFGSALTQHSLSIDNLPSEVLNYPVSAKRFLSGSDIDYLEQRLRQVFVTKEEFTEDRSELLTKLDEILTEVKAGREEQTILSHKVSVHEDRLASLEGHRST